MTPTVDTLPLSPLQRLAARISAYADAITAYNDTHNYPQRSLAPNSSEPTRLLPIDAPPTVRAKQTALIDAVGELQLLTTDASEFLPLLGVRHNQFACLRWLWHFHIPKILPTTPDEHLPSYRSLPYTEVAALAAVPEHQLRSIARMAILLGVLAEPEPDRLAHNPLSAALATSPQLNDWTHFLTSTNAPMVLAMVEATSRWGAEDDRALNHTAYNVAYSTDLPLFAHVATNPELQARFAGYMRAVTQSEGLALAHLAAGFNAGWMRAAQRGAVLVDVGGSAGHASASLARAFPGQNGSTSSSGASPGLRCLVQDLPEVTARAVREEAPRLEAEGLRITFQAHDFFTMQPATRPLGFEPCETGDVFLLRMILHDWGDADAAKIVGNLVPALRAGGPEARLIVMDTILPRTGESESRVEEALLRARDLTMLQALNAHERSWDEWVALFRLADPGLVVKRVVQPFASLMAVIEVAYESPAEKEGGGS